MYLKKQWVLLLLSVALFPLPTYAARPAHNQEDYTPASSTVKRQKVNHESSEESESEVGSDVEELARALAGKLHQKKERAIAKHLKSDKIISIHTQSQRRFFKHDAELSPNAKIQQMAFSFRKAYEQWPVNKMFVPIELTGLSSQKRIVLFRTISEIVREKEGDLRYFTPNRWGADSHCDIPYRFGKVNFSVKHNPTEKQPGNIFITGLLTFAQRSSELVKLSSAQQQKMAKQLLTNKKLGKPSQDEPLHDQFDLIFDLEISRRLPNKADLYDLPIASAIAWYLEDVAQGKQELSKFFEITDSEESGGYPYFYGPLNPFQGLPERRKQAIQNILPFRLMEESEILQRYKEVYGCEHDSSDDDQDE